MINFFSRWHLISSATQMKEKEEQLTAELDNMKQINSSLRESLGKEEAAKLVRIIPF